MLIQVPAHPENVVDLFLIHIPRLYPDPAFASFVMYIPYHCLMEFVLKFLPICIPTLSPTHCVADPYAFTTIAHDTSSQKVSLFTVRDIPLCFTDAVPVSMEIALSACVCVFPKTMLCPIPPAP